MLFEDVHQRSSLPARFDAAWIRNGRAAARWRVALGAAGPLAAALLLPDPRSQLLLLRDTRPDVVLGAVAVLVATLVIWALLGWAVLVGCAAIASRLPGSAGRLGRRLLRAVTPVALRRVVIAAAGLSLAAGLGACGGGGVVPGAVATAVSAGASTGTAADPAGTAHADLLVDLDWPVGQADSAVTDASAPDQTAGVDPEPVVPPADVAVPDQQRTRVTGVTATPLPQRHAELPAGPPDGAVVVLRGDSLWSIAAARLPEGASAAQVDASWRAWYATNRDVIGPDPNLILPGQRLLPPTTTSAQAVPATGGDAL